jgi:hypothetical protein
MLLAVLFARAALEKHARRCSRRGGVGKKLGRYYTPLWI